jgi:GT2 family glycosyltransferase
MIPNLTVATWTRHDLCDRMLRTVDVEVGHLLVIDNGGGFRVPDGPWARVSVLEMPTNLGVGPSWNLAFKCFYRDDVVYVVSDDVVLRPGSLAGLAAAADPDRLVTCGTQPFWCLFAAGQRFLERVGLFDERLWPAYYEDDDMAWRADRAGLPIVRSEVQVGHDNSSTLHTPDAGFERKNLRSFNANRILFQQKRDAGEPTPGWSAFRWRDQSWT